MSGTADLLTLGEAMVSLRSAGPLSAGGSLAMHVAGAESNVAAGVARLGHRARWAGVLGADPHGEFILKQLRSEGIDVQIRIDGGHSTGVMFLEQRTADISRAYYYRSGSAGSGLCREDVEQALGCGARVLHLTGITPALSPAAREAAEYAASSAAGRGMLVSLDVNYRGKLWSREEAGAALAGLVKHARIVIASEDELELVVSGRAGPDEAGGPTPGGAGPDEAAAAAWLLEHGVEEVVVKRGPAGAAVYTASGKLEAAAVPVTAVDTVGAGDAFTAGYLSALLDGQSPRERLRRGALMGAFAVSTAGDWEGLPNSSELALLEAQAAGTTQR